MGKTGRAGFNAPSLTEGAVFLYQIVSAQVQSARLLSRVDTIQGGKYYEPFYDRH